MAEYSKENLYYVTLKNDFFNEHYIKILKGMPNGDRYLLFYLELICESISHGGFLRYSKEIPYTIEMIASVTGTDIDTTRCGIEVLKGLGLIQITDGGSYYLPRVKEMTRITTKGAEKKQAQLAKRNKGGTGVENLPPEIRYLDNRDKSIESNSIYSVNSVDSVTKLQQVTTSYKPSLPASALVEVLVKNSFLTATEALDPQWEKLFDGLLKDHHQFVDLKIKTRYVVEGVTKIVAVSQGDYEKPKIVRVPIEERMPANKYLWFERALAKTLESDASAAEEVDEDDIASVIASIEAKTKKEKLNDE